ncbi:nitrite reductase small subunit NirD [Brevibacillus daliensis]|uniref:nitrite reductase small subunit NirD n=1 Tax=Brevibacillus daliensis TaxID=2892995 RepID=UPI001E3D6F2B|nr:nitrite reductase small subunit NirD [Brevibacillus daliensis]
MSLVEDQIVVFHKVGNIAEFPKRLGKLVRFCGEEIAIFRTDEDKFYAIENRNPNPKGGTLVDGMVSGEFIFDPLYDWKISLVTGRVQEPDEGIARVFDVKVENGEVSVVYQVKDYSNWIKREIDLYLSEHTGL